MKKGQKASEETRKRMSLARKGFKHTKEARRKMSEAKKGKYIGSKNPSWKGGFWIGKNGIKWINKQNGKEIAEYRLKVEKIIGRSLRSNEIVHHIDGDFNNNRNNNLLVCDRAYHFFLHKKMNPNLYKYKNRIQTKEEKERRAKKCRKPIIVKGIKYNSVKEAVEKTGLFSTTIRRRIKQNIKGYKYLNKGGTNDTN